MRSVAFIVVVFCQATAFSAELLSVRLADREIPVVEHRVRGRLDCAYAHFIVGEGDFVNRLVVVLRSARDRPGQ